MTEWRIALDLLAALATGRPHVLAAAGMPGLEASPVPVAVLRDGVLRPAGREAAGPVVPLTAAPGRLLACLAPEAAAARGLARAWGALGGTEPPPALAAESLAAALPDLARLLAAEAEAAAIARARIERGLAVLREEAEETRIALIHALRLLDGRLPPPPALALGTEPGEERVLAGPAPLSQPLGLVAEGLCAVALHVAAAGTGLRAVLRGAESGRILGAWTVPGAALAPGWLMLDLPAAIGPLRETAVLDLSAPEAPFPALSLEAGEVEPAGALEGRAGRALALRAWTAPMGGAFTLPLHHDWAAAGTRHLPTGIRHRIATPALEAARAEGARLELVAAGTEAPRAILHLAPERRATLRLPALDPGPTDLVRLEVALVQGDADAFAFALWAQPDDGEAALREEGPGCAASGWRLPEEDGRGSVTLPLPPGARCLVVEMMSLRGEAVAEVASLSLLAGAAGEARPEPLLAAAFAAPPALPDPDAPLRVLSPPAAPLEAPAGAPRIPLPDPAPAADLTTPQGASFDELKLHQHLVNADGSYRHVDVTLSPLLALGGEWREVRLKLFERRGVTGLEFRDMKGWPAIFAAWPGTATDAYGPFWRIESTGTADALARLSAPADRVLLAALLEVLPAAAERAARLAGLGSAEAEAWAARGARMAAAVREAG